MTSLCYLITSISPSASGRGGLGDLNTETFVGIGSSSISQWLAYISLL